MVRLFEWRRQLRRDLIGIRFWVKDELSDGQIIYLNQKYEPVGHISGELEGGDLLAAQIALIPKSRLPVMEATNDR